MTPLTVVCLLVRGEYPYTSEYVRRLHAMVTRYCTRPFRFVCLTDQPDAMPPGVEAIRVERIAGCFAFWTKLHVFRLDADWGGRVLYLDLDSLIVAPLDPIIDYPAAMALADDPFVLERPDLTTDRYGRRLIRRLQGSVMVWHAGAHAALWESWTLADAQRLSTDQDWVGEQVPDAVAMPVAWFPRLSRLGPPATWAPDATVILAKKPKGLEACARYPWFEPLWGGWAAA